MSIPAKVRAALHERASSLCEICGQSRGTNAHHRKNRSQGGRDVLSNLMLLCGSGTTGCHGEVTVSPRTAAKLGHTVLSYENPSEKPVLLFHAGVRRRVLIDDLGGVTPTQEAA